MAEADSVTRRDFIHVATGAFAATGAVFVAWPFVHQMNPSANVLALSTTEIDISAIVPGQIVTVMWQGKPVFIRRRTPQEIQQAENVDLAQLIDPQADKDRVQKPEWLVVSGICTHLGCVPVGHKGNYDGWVCPCHGSVYDTSGRVRKGPAPRNLDVPPYKFTTDTTVLIG